MGDVVVPSDDREKELKPAIIPPVPEVVDTPGAIDDLEVLRVKSQIRETKAHGEHLRSEEQQTNSHQRELARRAQAFSFTKEGVMLVFCCVVIGIALVTTGSWLFKTDGSYVH